MATEVRLPDDAPTWEFDFRSGPKDYMKAERDYLDALQKYVRARWRSPLSGEFVRWPMADGYAQYIIISERPFQIAHVNSGDAWQAHPETIRGFRVADARRQVAADKSLAELFSKPGEWLDTIEPGTIVHYNSSFGQWVRCEAVFDTWSDLDGDHSGIRLKPIALVGEIGKRQLEDGTWIHGWAKYDLPRYGLDGLPAPYSYHVKQVIEGELFRPNASNLWEYPEFDRKRRNVIDPTGLAPISLEPEPMTPEQEALAGWVRGLNEIRELTNSDGSDKFYTIESLERVFQSILDVIIKVRTGRD